jgi:SAM-dependent methyltransferase
MTTGLAFDPIWESVYAEGFSQRWPWDAVVSFVFRNAPRDRPRNTVSIVELGFGSGSNLWFAAHEGFRVAGIDGSATAVAQGKARLAAEGFEGDLRIGDFTQALPFADESFDLAIDRGALTCAGFTSVSAAIREVQRILRPGGAFLFCPYSTDHPAAGTGRALGDGLACDFTLPGLAGLGAISFWSEANVRDTLAEGWTITMLSRLMTEDLIDPRLSRGEWYAVARKS